jgi:hypothetical protein
MKFLNFLDQILEELSFDKEKASEPWTIEITKNEDKSESYNKLGELIITLSQIRNRMD